MVSSMRDAASFLRGGHPALCRRTRCRSCTYEHGERVQNVKTLSEPFHFVKCVLRASERPAVTQRSAGGRGVRPVQRGSFPIPGNGNRCLNAHSRLGLSPC